MVDRIAAARRQRDEVVAFCHTLRPEEWKAPSQAEGWSVQDVVAHMAAAAHGAFTPWMVAIMRSENVELSNDADAERRRSWPPDEVLAEYETWSSRMIKLLAVAQKPPLSKAPFKLGELGIYPMALMAGAVTFDTLVHLHHDIAPALGRSLPPPDPVRLAATNEWVLEGIPRMGREGLRFLDRPLTISLEGEGGGRWAVVPSEGGRKPGRIRPAPVPGSAATITGRVEEFAVWATRRRPWRDQDVTIDGDEPYATRFLDALKVV